MGNLLRILYSQSHFLTFTHKGMVDQWYELARLADYFDSSPCLQLWARMWLCLPVNEYAGGLQNLDKWIFISEVFRDSIIFKAATIQATLRMIIFGWVFS